MEVNRSVGVEGETHHVKPGAPIKEGMEDHVSVAPHASMAGRLTVLAVTFRHDFGEEVALGVAGELKQVLKVLRLSEMRTVPSAVVQVVGHEQAGRRRGEGDEEIVDRLDPEVQLVLAYVQPRRSGSPEQEAE